MLLTMYNHLISYDDEDGEANKDDDSDYMGLESDDDGDKGVQRNRQQDNGASKDLISIRQVLKTLLDSQWRDEDLFQAPLLLYTILKVDNLKRS